MNGPPQTCETPLAGGVSRGPNPKTDGAILAQAQPDGKVFATFQAELALRGHTLTRSVRADDGRVTWFVSRWGQSRAFGHWGDVSAFLAQIGGAP